MGDGVFQLSLDGTWEFAAQADQSWAPIRVPGCWEGQGFGLDLTGPVWYRRRFVVPAGWGDYGVVLRCEAVSYACRVWLDGRLLGEHEGMWDAFELPLGQLGVGSEHELLIEVEKQGDRFPLRETPVGFLPDLGVTFGGLWQPVSLQARGPLALVGLLAQTSLARGQVLLAVDLENNSDQIIAALLTIVLWNQTEIAAQFALTVVCSPGTTTVRQVLALDGLKLWSPSSPSLYRTVAEVSVDGQLFDRLERRLGLRELRVEGSHILLNGFPVYLRGILHWGYDAQRLCPTPSEAELRAELEQIKGFGFNLIKHCLYVPTRRTLELADELGLLSWLELPLWIPRMSDTLRARLRAQYPRIARQRAYHAGLIIWTLGCELNASVDRLLLRDLYRAVRQALPGDPTGGVQALLRDNSGSGECYGGLAADSADFYDYHFYCDPPNLPALVDAFAASYRPRRPWLFGEFNDSDTWRTLAALVSQLSLLPAREGEPVQGEPARGWWLMRDWSANVHIQQHDLPLAKQAETLAAHSLEGIDHEGLRLRSYRHALLMRKLTLERVRMYAEVGGYVVTVLNDQPISTAGLIDDLGREKFAPEEFQPFNADAVLALTWDLRRTWLNGGDRLLRRDCWGHWSGQVVRPHVVLSNYSAVTLGGGLHWLLEDERGQVILGGQVAGNRALAPGEVQELAMIEFVAPPAPRPRRLWLHVALEGSAVANCWPLWVYPEPRWGEALAWLGLYGGGELAGQAARLWPGIAQGQAALAQGRVVLATCWDVALEAFVHGGGAALLAVAPADPALPTQGAPFWREALKEPQPHPAWGNFLHDEIAGLQLYSLTTDYALDPAAWANWRGGEGYAPILRRIDARRYLPLDYLAELQLGQGRLVISTLRWQGGLGDCASTLGQQVAGQVLLLRVLEYLAAGISSTAPPLEAL